MLDDKVIKEIIEKLNRNNDKVKLIDIFKGIPKDIKMETDDLNPNKVWYKINIKNLENFDLFSDGKEYRGMVHSYLNTTDTGMVIFGKDLSIDDIYEIVGSIALYCFNGLQIIYVNKTNSESEELTNRISRENNIYLSGLLSLVRYIRSFNTNCNLLEIIVDSIEKQYLEDSSKSFTIEQINEIKEKIRMYNDFRKRVVEKEKKEEKQRLKEEKQKAKLLKSLKNEIKGRDRED